VTEQDAEMLAGVLGQCRELVYLDLNGNFMNFGPSGSERFVGVLAQVAALAHLDVGSGSRDVDAWTQTSLYAEDRGLPSTDDPGA
jgi:hypothetical protein